MKKLVLLSVVVAALRISAMAQSLPKAEVRVHNGTPTLFINGEPNAGFTYFPEFPTYEGYVKIRETGIDLAQSFTTANYHYSPLFADPPVWQSRDTFDFSTLDKQMNLLVNANPGFWVTLRVYLFSPPWWDEENPGELMRYEDGSADKPLPGLKKSKLPSWSSLKWRADAGYCLRRLIQHVRSQPYGRRVIGYIVGGGGTDEWGYWSRGLDYSRPHLDGFQRWLRDKYGSVAELRRRWNNTEIDFESVRLPTWAERTQIDYFQFRDPGKSQNVIDYYDYTADMLTEAVTYFLGVVKEATNRESLAGSFFGYSIGSRQAYHLEYAAFHKFLSSPDLDFVTGPTSYAWREVGTGLSTWRTVYESVRVHGKLWFDENDYRTHLLPWTAGFGRTANFPDSEAAQLRQLANQIVHGAATWWCDIANRFKQSPEFLELLRKLNAIGRRSIHFDRSSTAEIAAIYDEKSQLAVEEETTTLYRAAVFNQNYETARLGAPVDWLLLDDLEAARPYKVYLLLNVYRPTERQKEMIKALASRGAKAVVFGYGSGYIGADSLDVKHSYELTGIRVKEEGKSGPLLVKLSEAAQKLLPGVRTGMMFGSESTIGPLIYAHDASAQVLGLMHGHGVPGLVCKELNGTQVYYSGAPTLSSAVLRGIAARAGVHIYNSRDEATYVNHRFLGIHTAESGVREILFPNPTDVYDLYNERMVARRTTRLVVDLPVRRTFLYFLGSEQEWRGKTR